MDFQGYKLALTPLIDEKDNILDTLSTYSPNDRVKDRLAEIRQMLVQADRVRHYPYREFGYIDLETKINNQQSRFINLIEPIDETDPSTTWRANTIRPLTRNKVVEVASYVTANIMYPRVVAQNKLDDVDKAHSDLMEDAMQWANEQSGYDQQIGYAVLGMLVFPGTIMQEGYVDYKRDFKIIKEDGTFDIKKMTDAVYSGYQCEVRALDEIYFGDAYAGKNIQKQPFIVDRRIISYADATIKYGENQDFKDYVRPGVRIFSDSSNTFYSQQEMSFNDNMVEELTIYSRVSDLELRIVNGVLMDDPDRPIQREDKLYPFAMSGYGLYDSGQFVYWMSMVDDLSPDQDAADMLINYILDGTYLQMMPATALYGDDVIDRSIMVPGMTTSLAAGSKIESISPQGNIGLGMNVLQGIENNASQSSKQNVSQQDMTAYQTSRIEEEIKTKLGGFGKNLAYLVVQFGNLRLPTIVEHMTMPQLGKIADPNTALKYTTMLVKKRGETNSKQIELSDSIPYGENETDKVMKMSLDLLKRQTGSGKTITQVNPEAIRDLKFTCHINADTMFKRSEEGERAFALEFYDRGILNPMFNQESLAGVLVNEFKPGQEDKFVNKPQPQAPAMAGGVPGKPIQGGGQAIQQLSSPNLPPTPKPPVTVK